MAENVAPRVLIVGATGVFGHRLTAQLAAEPGIAVILVGRTESSLIQLRAQLGGDVVHAVLDRERVKPADLHRLGADVVIDAAGPFQDSRTGLIRAAIAAGCHYADFADGRDFVAAIRRFDAAARARDVAVLAGASSTPALSHAALDRLTGGWRQIDSIRVAICPGNRTPRSLSVVRAILSYAGQPVRVFRNSAWTTAAGWGRPEQIAIAGIGKRLASLCETPDLDLLVERYRPRASAEFYAGLESRLLHRGLRLSTLLVRWRLLRSLTPLARPLHFIASLLLPFGTDRGGMIADATGRDADGRPIAGRWTLAAYRGTGPFVPTLAALALVRKVRDGTLQMRGAQPCVGILSIDDFAADFARLGFETGFSWSAQPAAPDNGGHARLAESRETTAAGGVV